MQAAGTDPLRWRSIDGLRTALVSLIALNAAAAVGAILARGYRLQVIDDVSGGSVSFNSASTADDYVDVTAVIYLLTLLASGVIWIIWQWRVAKNAELLGRRGQSWGPGWSIGGWFIPCASLVIPAIVMQRLWRASDPNGGPQWLHTAPSGLVGLWWTAFVISNILANADFTFGAEEDLSLNDIRNQDRLGILGMLAWLASAALAYLVVSRLTERQTELRAITPQLQRTTSFGAALPGWYADPSGEFQSRYWDGTRWTEHVATQGTTSTDPPNPTAPL